MSSDKSAETITRVQRELYLRIINGEVGDNLQRIGQPIHFLYAHFPPKYLNKALIWLISHNIVGKAFIAWYNNTCDKSDLEMHRLLLSVVENDVLKPIIAGKNFKQ